MTRHTETKYSVLEQTSMPQRSGMSWDMLFRFRVTGMNTLRTYMQTLATPVFSGTAFLLAQTAVAHAADCANGDTGCLGNPLKAEFSSIPLFIAGALKVIVMLALPIIVLFFVIAGFKFISAQGNPSKLEEARKNFVWVVIGALLIMGAWVLATLLANTVSQLVGP